MWKTTRIINRKGKGNRERFRNEYIRSNFCIHGQFNCHEYMGVGNLRDLESKGEYNYEKTVVCNLYRMGQGNKKEVWQ